MMKIFTDIHAMQPHIWHGIRQIKHRIY